MTEQLNKELGFLIEAINECQATKVEKAAIRGWLIDFVRRNIALPQAEAEKASENEGKSL